MKQFLTFFFLLLTIGLFAQPVNDDCSGIVDLGVAPNCDSTLYNNTGALESDIGADNFPPCFVGVPARDVWFQFTATSDFLDYRIEVIGCEDVANGVQAMSNPQVAIYRGDCEFNGLQLLDCGSAVAGESSILIDLIGLTPGIPYFLRINDWTSTATPNDGAFKVCVKEKPPVNQVNQGGSTECSGILTDSGGEFGDYGDNEDFTYTICPSQPHECILFDMQYYNVEYAADQIYFYDGPDVFSSPIGNISGDGIVPTPNEGGVCYSVAASSGCLTIQFISDGDVSFEGFLGSWQCTSDACPEAPEMIVDADQNVDQIVESVISGQTLISLVEVQCSQGAVGTFTVTDDSDLNMDKGLVLSSGSVLDIPQPADAFAANFYCGLSCSDDDLNTLSLLYGNGEEAEDACIVEMDVLAASEELTFEYVFGSEEYPDFISPGTSFNDIFAFLVSGPGITGDPNIGNKLNVATLPDGTFIQIEDVNQSDNWQYYRDNSNSQSIIYGGLTSDSIGVKKSLTARVPTIPCETYKLKFAIADRGDSSYDSGVFISKINSGTPEVSMNFQNGINYLVESCTDEPDEVLIQFGNQINSPQTFTLILGGTATNGDDYELTLPNTITFETGTEIFTFPITVLVDMLDEGTETIEISLARDFGCGQTIVSTVVVDLQDALTIDVLNDIQDTTILCVSNGSIPLEVTGAEEYQWFPDSLFDDPTSSTPVITTDSAQWVYVQGTLGQCTDLDSVYINAIDVQVTILPDQDNIEVCEGETVTLFAQNNVNDQNLIWNSFFNTFDDPTDPEQVIVDESGFNFDAPSVTIDIGGCTATDNITINWVPFDLPQMANDTIICQNSSVQLAEDIESFSTTYEWSPNEFLEPGNDVSGPIATPEETTTYTLISMAGDGDNVCGDTSTVTITVLPADVNIEPMDTVFICAGETATLTNTTTNNVIDLTWTPLNDLTLITPNEVEVNPMESQYYYAVLETPDCIVMDSVWVQVDSLPDLSIMADPEKDTYCEGEEVYLISPTYEPANFPTIDHNWIPGQPGAQTPDTFFNMVIIALEDFTYTRTTTVNACESTDTIFIEVTPVTSISVIPSDTTVCQGEQVQFMIEGPAELTDFMWMPPDGLNNAEIREPIATASGTITYQVEAEFEGCPVGAAATINVPSQFFQYSGPNPICPGTSVLLNNFSVPGATYSWTSSDGSLTTNEAQPVVAPTQTTTYNLVANIGSCSFETSLTIDVLTNFNLSIDVFPDEILCPGETIILTAAADPLPPNIVYTWTNPFTGEQINGVSIEVAPNATATWEVSAFDNCFTNTADYDVEVAPTFTVSVNPPFDNVLAGAPSTFTAEATVAGIDFQWQEIPGGAVIGNDPSITVTNCETQEYLVTGTDFNGCTQTAGATQFVQDGFSVSPPILVTETGDTIAYFDTLTNMFVIDTFDIYEGEQIQMLVDVTPPSPGYTYTWMVGDITVSTTNDPSSGLFYLPEVNTDFTDAGFSVMVVSSDGCTGEGQTLFDILNNPVEMPNVFTPNGDNTNDSFAPVSIRPVDVLEFRIWNRWGDLVYENQDGAGVWDGTIDGDPAASDVYIYSVVYQIPGSDNPMSPLRGDVTLLR